MKDKGHSQYDPNGAAGWLKLVTTTVYGQQSPAAHQIF
jgi:hypothetical protein